jgi:hypothetical protein
MVKDANVEQPQRLFQPLGDELVRLAGFGHARWMVVGVMYPGPLCGAAA